MHASQKKSQSRKKFLLLTAAALCSTTVLQFIPGRKKKQSKKEGDTVKMLTQDGKLVEIDKKFLALTRKKISDKELQQWIKR